jgi:uncharacterized protein (TIGR02678 family)
MPEEGTDGHATLLLAEYLASSLKQRGAMPVPISAVHIQMADWAREHRPHWRKGTSEPGAEVAMCASAIHRLHGLGLVRLDADTIVPLPALGRFHYQPAVLQVPLEPELS